MCVRRAWFARAHLWSALGLRIRLGLLSLQLVSTSLTAGPVAFFHSFFACLFQMSARTRCFTPCCCWMYGRCGGRLRSTSGHMDALHVAHVRRRPGWSAQGSLRANRVAFLRVQSSLMTSSCFSATGVGGNVHLAECRVHRFTLYLHIDTFCRSLLGRLAAAAATPHGASETWPSQPLGKTEKAATFLHRSLLL